MIEKSSTRKPANPRPRSRSTASIIKAAKAAGAASVTFPDGTVVMIGRDDGPVIIGNSTLTNPWELKPGP
jgi:hypothetical protein